MPKASDVDDLHRIGVVGLGVMGTSIARHLFDGGFSVIGCDISADARSRTAARGIDVTTSVAELVESVNVVVASLPSPEALTQVTDGIIAAARHPRFLIETSTLSLPDKEVAAERLAAVSTTVLDCPISGTGRQMELKDAIIYASGDDAACDAVLPILECFSREVHRLGPFGNGTKMKFVANLLVAIHNVAAAEALALAARAGLSMPTVLAALTAGAGSSRMLEVRGPMMLERTYVPATMRVGLFQKDLRLIDDYVASSDAAAPLFHASLGSYEEANLRGLSDEDTAAVFEVFIDRQD